MEFEAHPSCKECPLWELSRNPGIPTRQADFQSAPSHGRCLLVVGQNPGGSEDSEGRSWIGQAGQLLHAILKDHLEADSLGLDIYLANTCRCRTPNNDDPTIKPRKACWPHLQSDIQRLVDHYGESNVWVLALGAPAVWTCTKTSIKRSVITQGAPRKFHLWPDGPAFRMFFSYHPAALLPGRNPSLMAPMSDHLSFLRDALQGKEAAPELPATVLTAPVLLPGSPSVVSLDIETYGILQNTNQTVFHPKRMMAVDGRTRSNIIIRAAVAWENDGRLQTATYRWPDHIPGLRSALGSLPPTTILLGMNLCFDLSVLKFCDPKLSLLFRIDRFLLDDLAILNHLDADMRPERSLKAVSTLFHTMDYGSMKVNAKAGLKAESADDPNLILYNCADTLATLRNYKQHLDHIRRQHGPGHPALHPPGAQFRSDLLWSTLHMIESGAEFDRAKLTDLHTSLLRKQEELVERLYARNVIVCGRGSEKSLRAVITAALNTAALMKMDDSGAGWTFLDDRVQLTNKRKEISTGKENIHLLLDALPQTEVRDTIESIEAFRKSQKVTSSYTGPLLQKPAEGLVGSRAWPTWFPVPGHIKDTSSEEGGTRQGRYSAKKPALQTPPKAVVSCMTSRYGEDGIVAAYDLSQEELRMATLIFGDPNMMDAYLNDRDIHAQTATAIWPDLEPDAPDFDKKRRVGKHVNFLALYLGGWRQLIATVRRLIGWELGHDDAKFILTGYDNLYREFRLAQRRLINQVSKEGSLVLPVTGWKRTFLGGPDVASQTYANEIANMPVQTLAAQCLISSHAQLIRERHKNRWNAAFFAQCHDALYVDCHRSWFAEVDSRTIYWLENSPLWRALEDHYGRTVPTRAERDLLFVGSRASHLIPDHQPSGPPTPKETNQ